MPDNSIIDNKKIAEELYKKNVELLEQGRWIEQLLYSVSEAVVAVDENFNITIFNKAAENLIGQKSDAVKGTRLDTVLHLEYDGDGDFNLLEHCFNKNENSISGLVLHGTKDYYVNYSSNIIHKYDRRECLITLTDITYEKSLDKTKDEFISVTSHELRTPMTIIKSYLWMVLSGKAGEINTKEKEYLNKAMSGVERMLSMINDMLNISRLEQSRIQFERENFEINSYIKDFISEFEIKAAEKGIYLKGEGLDKNIIVNADKDKTTEILTNLVGNSLKFTKQGGITIKVDEGDDFVLIQVTDTGAGIEPDDQQRLFHKFGRLNNSYQTVAESGGTGLGLYIVKLYVEGMGGKIGVRSEGKGKGSTFWFILKKA